MSYVLTVVANGTLEHVGLFAGYRAASEAALQWSKIFAAKEEFIDSTPVEEHSSYPGDEYTIWRFVDTTKVQVSVQFMVVAVNPPPIPANLKVKGALFTAQSLPVGTTVQVAGGYVTNRGTLPTPHLPPGEDDPLADHLPAGWSYPDKKPVTIGQLKAGQDCLMASELSEDQKWALVTARVSKRPKCLFLLPPYGNGLYSQTHALSELKNKTEVGRIIVMLDLMSLAYFLGDEESEDPQMMDGVDESSSDSFDHR